ncbi:DNA gyrase subunit A, partial [Salmonella enterica]|uniref:DNA gyrase subunit A n=1 Tax=Salmonella enterica TaxID=28901 RepID=UPI000B288360
GTAAEESGGRRRRVAERVDGDELDARGGSVAEGDEEIDPEAESDDDVADDADE